MTFEEEIHVVFETLNHVYIAGSNKDIEAVYDKHIRRVQRKYGIEPQQTIKHTYLTCNDGMKSEN